MNHMLFDLLPVLLFFIAFKFYGIYAATWVGIISTFLQATIYRYTKKHWDKMQVTTFIVFVIFGGMTLYFHNPIFVKWKPTIIFWIFALALFLSHFIGQKTLMQRMVEGAFSNPDKVKETIVLPDAVGKRVNMAWTLFFLILGAVNLYVAYNFTDNVWVNFKLYGITTLTIVFSVLQTLYLVRYIKSS